MWRAATRPPPILLLLLSTDWRARPRQTQAGVLRLLHDLSEHMYKEDFGLFPAALATLDGADWDEMDRRRAAGATLSAT